MVKNSILFMYRRYQTYLYTSKAILRKAPGKFYQGLPFLPFAYFIHTLYSFHMNDYISAATKNKQSSQVLIAIAEKAFNVHLTSENFTELNGGYCNVIYKISLPQPAILKIAPSPNIELMSYEKNLLQTEVSVLRLVEKQTSIRCPHVLFYDDSCSLCNAPYFIMSIIAGDTLSTLPKPSANLQNKYKATIGNYLSQLNKIHNNYYGLFSDCLNPQKNDTSTVSDNNRDFMLKLFRMTLDDGIKKNCDLKATSYDGLWQLIVKNSSFFETNEKAALVHWDLWEGNEFVEHNEISGIIDFERALWADPLMENEFSSFLQPTTSFLNAYGKTEFTPEENIRRQFYKIYRELVMIIECPYRNYETPAQYNWVTAELKKDLPLLVFMINNYRSVTYNTRK